MRRRALLLAWALSPLSAACDAGAPAPAPAASARPAPPPPPPAPAPKGNPSNPLGLPPVAVALDPGKRVFTTSQEMLAGAKPGSTLVLYASTVVALDGDDLVVEGRGGPAYKVHPGYVIPVPDDARVRVGDAVLTEWSGVMKHAVVTKIAKGRVSVRYTDMDPRAAEGHLKGARFVRQTDGLRPGNYAVHEPEPGKLEHVLLVSSFGPEGDRRWLALGFGSAGRVVAEAALRPIPVKFSAQPGTEVLAEWLGKMRPGTVTATTPPAFFTVRFERAGRPVTRGWGFVTEPSR